MLLAEFRLWLAKFQEEKVRTRTASVLVLASLWVFALACGAPSAPSSNTAATSPQPVQCGFQLPDPSCVKPNRFFLVTVITRKPGEWLQLWLFDNVQDFNHCVSSHTCINAIGSDVSSNNPKELNVNVSTFNFYLVAVNKGSDSLQYTGQIDYALR